MKPFTLEQIINSCNGAYRGKADRSAFVTAIVTDSRNIQKGALFAAIVGERVDGHDFIEDCYQKGAVCVLCEKAPANPQIPYILVDSTLEAIKQIAKAYRELFSIPFIGITGSVGKTSTKEMIAAVLGQTFCVHKTQGNFNNELGVPLTLFGLEETHQAAVIEMGISDFGEMRRLTAMVQPDYCVITNIGNCHLENLKDRDGVLKAKSEIFLSMKKNGKAFLNGDDDRLAAITEVNGGKPILYGLGPNNRYYAENVKSLGANGIACDLCFDNTKLHTVIPAIGNHMVINALAAVALGKELGMDNSSIIAGVESYKTVGSRSNLIKTESYTVIDDCYNANPTSVRASIDMLFQLPGRKVCILGDMKELGAGEQQLHLQTGQYAAEKGVDLVITVGPLAKYIKKGAENGHTQAVSFDTIDDMLRQAGTLLKQGDVILVKASRSMHFETIVNTLQTQI